MTKNPPTFENVEEFSPLEMKVYLTKREGKDQIDKLCELYFSPKKLERGQLYEKLGVRLFEKAALGTIGRLCRRGKNYPDNFSHFARGSKLTLNDIDRYETNGRIFEACFVFCTALMTTVVINHVYEGRYGLAVALAGADLILGIYPTLQQRYNRAKIYNTIDQKLGSFQL